MVGPPAPFYRVYVMVPMVPNLVSSPRVLDKRALILVNQIFLLLAKLLSALSDMEYLVSVVWL
jgi:hypothetical protein